MNGKSILSVTAALLSLSYTCLAQTDTLELASSYTTHIIFATDITYADLSNSSLVAARVVEQNRNIVALKAKTVFNENTNISVLESNGKMHTFIIQYDDSPDELIVDMREFTRQQDSLTVRKNTRKENVSFNGKKDAPLLQDVIKYKQRLYHLGCIDYGISIMCENIISYSDITYIVLSLKNGSGVSYDISDPTFVLESKRKGKRKVEFEKTLFPRSRYGQLGAGPGDTSRAVYSFDKMSLSNDQVLKIYFYEESGQRNLEMTLDTSDINKAGVKLE